MKSRKSVEPVADFPLEDLVVETSQLRLVEQELHRLGVWPQHPAHDRYETSEALGLTLLKGLEALPNCAAGLRSANSEDIARLEDLAEAPDSFTDLDVLLLELRTNFAERFGGWVPELGKNRNVAAVVTTSDGVASSIVKTAGPCGGKSCVMGNAFAVPNPAIARDFEEFAIDRGTSASEASGTGVRVGVLDVLPYRHERLVGHVPDAAFLDPRTHGAVWLPWEGHGTFVASLVLRQAPGAQLDMRAMARGDSGRASSWDVATGIVGFVGSGIKVLNLSLGCHTADGRAPLLLTRAVERLDPDVLVVAAAGNHGCTEIGDQPFWPAALPGVVAVGAHRERGSQFSPNLPWVTCTADGVDVVGAFLQAPVTLPTVVPSVKESGELTGRSLPDQQRRAIHRPDREPVRFDGYARWRGTSFAAATVSGAVAAAIRYDGTAREAFDRLLEQGDVVRRFEYAGPQPCEQPDDQPGGPGAG